MSTYNSKTIRVRAIKFGDNVFYSCLQLKLFLAPGHASFCPRKPIKIEIGLSSLTNPILFPPTYQDNV